MIYKPTDLSPSAQTFDVKDTPLFFECKVDTSNVQARGFTIKILNSENDTVFSSIPEGKSLNIKYITLIEDLEKYTKEKFPEYLKGYDLINTGYNGTYVKIPLFVDFDDRATSSYDTMGANQIFYSTNVPNGAIDIGSNLYVYAKNGEDIDYGNYISLPIYNGHEYKWSITFYQLEKNQNGEWQLPENPLLYDMPLTVGTALGSNNIRIQSVLSNEIYGDYFVQPVKINGLKYDPDNPSSWIYSAVEGEDPISQNDSNRVMIKSYDTTYGYIYPQTGDNGFADETITPDNANGFRIYKRGNNKDNLTTYQQVVYVLTSPLDSNIANEWNKNSSYEAGSIVSYSGIIYECSTDVASLGENPLEDSSDWHVYYRESWNWNESYANPGESYGIYTTYSSTDPNGVYLIQGKTFTGNERTILNQQSTNAAYNDGEYLGSPYNGLYYPQFSVTARTAYNPSYNYQVGDTVKYNTYVYSCMGAVQGKIPGKSTKYWEMVQSGAEIVGSYDETEPYHTGDVVKFNDAKYKCTGTVYNEAPSGTNTDNIYWQYTPDIPAYKITARWMRTPDADSWGELMNKIVLVTNGASAYYGKNLQIKDINENADAYGTINETPFKFVQEEPIEIYKNSYSTYNINSSYDVGSIVRYLKTGSYSQYDSSIIYNPGQVVYTGSPAVHYICIQQTSNQEESSPTDNSKYWSKYKAQSYYISQTEVSSGNKPVTDSGELNGSNWSENQYLGNTGLIFYNNELGDSDEISSTESKDGRLYIKHFDGISEGMAVFKNTLNNKQQYFKIKNWNADYNFATYDKIYTFNTYQGYVPNGGNPTVSSSEDVDEGWIPANQIGAGTKYQVKTFFRESDENAFYFASVPMITFNYENTAGVDFIKDKVVTGSYDSTKFYPKDSIVTYDNKNDFLLYDSSVEYSYVDKVYTGDADVEYRLEGRSEGSQSGWSGDLQAPRQFEADKYYMGATMNNWYVPGNVNTPVITNNDITITTSNPSYSGYGIGIPFKIEKNYTYVVFAENNGAVTATDTIVALEFYKDGENETQIPYINPSITDRYQSVYGYCQFDPDRDKSRLWPEGVSFHIIKKNEVARFSNSSTSDATWATLVLRPRPTVETTYYNVRIYKINQYGYISLLNNNTNPLNDLTAWEQVLPEAFGSSAPIKYIALTDVPAGIAPSSRNIGTYWQQYTGTLFEDEGYVPAQVFQNNVQYQKGDVILYDGLYYYYNQDDDNSFGVVDDSSETNEQGDTVWALSTTINESYSYSEGAYGWDAGLLKQYDNSSWNLYNGEYNGYEYINGVANNGSSTVTDFDESKVYLNGMFAFFAGSRYEVIAATSTHVPTIGGNAYFKRADNGQPLNYPVSSNGKKWNGTKNKAFIMGDVVLAKSSSYDIYPDRYWVKNNYASTDTNTFVPPDTNWETYCGPIYRTEYSSTENYDYNNVVSDSESGLYYINKNNNTSGEPADPRSLKEWSLNSTYQKGDLVVYNDYIYEMISSNDDDKEKPKIPSDVWGLYKWQVYIPEITERTLTVSADYSQQQFIQWKSAQWFLLDANGEEIIDKSEVFYDGDLGYTFHGLEGRESSGGKNKYYIIRLIIETYNGYRLAVESKIEIMLTIQEIDAKGLINLSFDCDTTAVKVDITKESGFIIPPLESNATYDKETETMSLQGQMTYGKVSPTIEDVSVILRATDLTSEADRFVYQAKTKINSNQFGGDIVALESHNDDKEVGIFSIYVPDLLKEVNTAQKYPNDTVLSTVDLVTTNPDKDTLTWIAGTGDTPLKGAVTILNGDDASIISDSGDLNQIYDNQTVYNTVPVYQRSGFDTNAYTHTNYLPVSFETTKDGSTEKYLNVDLDFNIYSSNDWSGTGTGRDIHIIQNPIVKQYQFNDDSVEIYNNNDDSDDKFGTVCFVQQGSDSSEADQPIRVKAMAPTMWSDYEFITPNGVLVGTNSSTDYYTYKNIWQTTGWKWSDSELSTDGAMWYDSDYINTYEGYDSLLGEIKINGTTVSQEWFNQFGDHSANLSYSETYFKTQERVSDSIKERVRLNNKEFVFDIDLTMDNTGYIQPTYYDNEEDEEVPLKVVVYVPQTN